jgi:hypothetical protein
MSFLGLDMSAETLFPNKTMYPCTNNGSVHLYRVLVLLVRLLALTPDFTTPVCISLLLPHHG